MYNVSSTRPQQRHNIWFLYFYFYTKCTKYDFNRWSGLRTVICILYFCFIRKIDKERMSKYYIPHNTWGIRWHKSFLDWLLTLTPLAGRNRYIWFMPREARLLLQSNTLNLGTNGTLYWWQIWWTVKCKMLTFLAALIDFFLWFHLLQRLAARQERGSGPTLNIKKQ